MALEAGSQIIFLNEYSSCNISRNDYQENSLTNGKSNSLRSRIKSLLNPNFVIKEYKKKINLKENSSLFYLESIFSYIFNANLKNLQNLLSLDKTRIVQNYILNFYYNHFYWLKDKIKKISNIGIYNYNSTRILRTSNIDDELSILFSLGKSIDYNIRKSHLLEKQPSKSTIVDLENNNSIKKFTNDSSCFKIQSENSLRINSIISSLLYNEDKLTNHYMTLSANDLCLILYDIIIYDRTNPFSYQIFERITSIKNELSGVFVVLFAAISTIINKAHILLDLDLPDISNYSKKAKLNMQTPPWLFSCLLLNRLCNEENYEKILLEKIKLYPLDYHIYISTEKYSTTICDLDLKPINDFLHDFVNIIYDSK